MELIKIGKIVNTHGIKGELRILSKFPYKEKVFIKNMKVYIDKKNIEIINTYRKHKNFDMVTFEGYSNINEVLKYKGKNIYINKDVEELIYKISSALKIVLSNYIKNKEESLWKKRKKIQL